jgi:hypothetical protein
MLFHHVVWGRMNNPLEQETFSVTYKEFEVADWPLIAIGEETFVGPSQQAEIGPSCFDRAP